MNYVGNGLFDGVVVALLERLMKSFLNRCSCNLLSVLQQKKTEIIYLVHCSRTQTSIVQRVEDVDTPDLCGQN
jgi:hypothetical protein